MAIKITDLPPKYQAQALAKLARTQKAADPAAVAARAVAGDGKDFDSRGEYDFYLGTVLPKLRSGEIVAWCAHPSFSLFPAGEYCGIKLSAIRYTPDFRLEYADGTVEIVEVKSKFVRRMQRDYALRRRVFLEQIARPAGWIFREIITSDTAEDVKKWRKIAKQGKMTSQA